MNEDRSRKDNWPVLRAAIRGLCYGVLIGFCIDLFWIIANGYWTLLRSQPGTAAEIVAMAALVGAIVEALRVYLQTTSD
jgi:hypothetical protein